MASKSENGGLQDRCSEVPADLCNHCATGEASTGVIHVRGGQIADSGHYIPEEQPTKLSGKLCAFLGALIK
jgi:hypothetical protein